jgi:hypothetical protein
MTAKIEDVDEYPYCWAWFLEKWICRMSLGHGWCEVAHPCMLKSKLYPTSLYIVHEYGSYEDTYVYGIEENLSPAWLEQLEED